MAAIDKNGGVNNDRRATTANVISESQMRQSIVGLYILRILHLWITLLGILPVLPVVIVLQTVSANNMAARQKCCNTEVIVRAKSQGCDITSRFVSRKFRRSSIMFRKLVDKYKATEISGNLVVV